VDVAVRAAFWRGGTSRAVLFRGEDLAEFGPAQRDAVILAALGSPDPNGREIDGLGGGISSLSKAAIIDRAPAGSGADVTFQFAQVDVETPRVEFVGTCGNISAAVGPFALDTGLVEAPAVDEARIVVLSVNTGQRYVAHVPLRAGRYDPAGDFLIDGVPGPGARIGLEYLDPAGSIGHGLLPTGRPRERLDVGPRTLEVSIVDVANPAVFVRAADLGATGREPPSVIDADRALVETLEAIRDQAAARIGLAGNKAQPKVAMVAPPQDDLDLLIRMLSMGKTHRTLAMTVAICAAAASAVDGTVVSDVARPMPGDERVVRLGHPAGVLPIGIKTRRQPDGWVGVVSATTYRTARKIMDGSVYVPEAYLAGTAWFQ
jgi:2-methylaconitate cis-trans-isomerase PrpF